MARHKAARAAFPFKTANTAEKSFASLCWQGMLTAILTRCPAGGRSSTCPFLRIPQHNPVGKEARTAVVSWAVLSIRAKSTYRSSLVQDTAQVDDAAMGTRPRTKY